MKVPIDRSRFKVYLRIGAYYLLLSTFGDLLRNQAGFFATLWNHIWLISYLVVLNYILYEAVLPSVKFTWRQIVVIPVGLFVLLMFCSFGFYAWRSIGAALHLYFPLKEYASITDGVEHHISQSIF